MKCWTGDPERNDARTRTLFVKTAELTVEKVNIVRGLAFANGVQRLYFGAGRLDTNVKGFSKRVVAEIRSKLEPLYDIVIETTAAFVDTAQELDGIADEIILRHEVPNFTRPSKSRLTLKVDNIYRWCAVAGRLIATDITGLKNGLYPQDKEIKV